MGRRVGYWRWNGYDMVKWKIWRTLDGAAEWVLRMRVRKNIKVWQF
jgi:hypothetical protein